VDTIRKIVGPIEGGDAGRAALAGAAGAAAYLAEMAVDLPLLDCPTNDLLLLGGLFTRNPRVWPFLGVALHFGNGVALAQVYAAVEDRFPGPPWLRGTLFTLVENGLLWVAIPVFDRIHPAIRAGALPKMNRPIPLLQQVLRHIAYGAVLGMVYGQGKRR
jgi:hypothetical protein